MAITIKTIDELLTGNFEDSSPIMFGIGTNIFKTTWGQLKADIVGQNVSEIKYQLLTDNRIVDKQFGDNFLANRNATIGSGQLTFIQFNVIYEDSSLGLNTYLIPLGEGVYNPLGNSIAFNDLILIDRVETQVTQDNTNTTTYTVASLADLNNSDPSLDFTNIEFVYFVLLDDTLYRFKGVNGLYGLNDLQMVMNDLQIVKGADTIPSLQEVIDVDPNYTFAEFPSGIEIEDDGGGLQFIAPNQGYFGINSDGTINIISESNKLRIQNSQPVDEGKILKVNAQGFFEMQDDEVILTSPNNTKYKLTVDDSGNLSTEII